MSDDPQGYLRDIGLALRDVEDRAEFVALLFGEHGMDRALEILGALDVAAGTAGVLPDLPPRRADSAALADDVHKAINEANVSCTDTGQGSLCLDIAEFLIDVGWQPPAASQSTDTT